MITGYIQGKYNINQLFSFSESQGKKVATEEQIKGVIDNNYTLSYLCEEHKISKKHITKKLNKILDRLGEK